MSSLGATVRECATIISKTLVTRTSVLSHLNTSNAYYPPHTHRGLTTHLILSGALTISYPDDSTPTKETFGVDGRVDVDANRRHEVWIGPEGCTYVIGE